MGRTPSAYDVLGLPYDAHASQVRSRYRQLARRVQPDLQPQDLLQDDGFLRLLRAYLVLDSPRRTEYTRMVRASRDQAVETPDLYTRLPRDEQLLVAAEAGLARRQYKAAAVLAKEAIELNSRSARAYALLGDVLRLQAKYPEAIAMYNYAIQFEPDNRRYWQLLDDTSALREGRRITRPQEADAGQWQMPVQSLILLVAMAVIIELSILILRSARGPSLFFGLPAEMLAIAALDGMLAGIILAANNLLASYDDEMTGYLVATYGAEMAPLAVFVFLPGIVCFWIAVGFYAVVAYLDERVSPSVTLALAATAVLTVAFAMVYPDARLAFLVLGGNFIWVGFNLGWMIGGLRRRVVAEE